ncbi:hypothetical protein BC827DRAFT_801962 [Russula dissimulans]|nr:hypothetical protein BC827DRAFT_801962 [Russula dissimulans]
MSSPTPTSTNFRSILDSALDNYAKQTGIDLTNQATADRFGRCNTSEHVLQLLQEREAAFRDFRNTNLKLINCLRPVVQVIHSFSGIFGGLVPFPPTKLIFSGLDILLAAATRVSASYDALVELFDCIGSFLKRLQIYSGIPLNNTMMDILIMIMVEVLSVLALATKQIKQGRFKKFGKKLLGESDVEAVLNQLGRLTQEETRVTVTHVLEVVYGLVNNVKMATHRQMAYVRH